MLTTSTNSEISTLSTSTTKLKYVPTSKNLGSASTVNDASSCIFRKHPSPIPGLPRTTSLAPTHSAKNGQKPVMSSCRISIEKGSKNSPTSELTFSTCMIVFKSAKKQKDRIGGVCLWRKALFQKKRMKLGKDSNGERRTFRQHSRTMTSVASLDLALFDPSYLSQSQATLYNN